MVGYYTVSEYMKVRGIKSVTTVYKQIKNKMIQAENIGAGLERPTWRIPIEQFERKSSQTTTASA